jgi:hypothetical protein
MSAQAVSEPGDRCPRCGGAFDCGMHDAAPCACTGIALDPPTLARLHQLYAGCLCLDCLHALAAGDAPEPARLSASCG